MKTEWDYTTLADAYLKRPDYADAAINAMLAIAGAEKGDRFCDVGAGVAHLTLMLASRGLDVIAVEPNDAMREYACKDLEACTEFNSVNGTAEKTTLDQDSIDLVVVAQAFHWFDETRAVKEFQRILKKDGALALLWNVRNHSENSERPV